MKYRKKPVTAIQWTGTNTVAIRRAFGVTTRELYRSYGFLSMWSSQGVAEARKGDWIIKDADGELSTCPPNIFSQTYEPVENKA